jgi:hypothetical protein
MFDLPRDIILEFRTQDCAEGPGRQAANVDIELRHVIELHRYALGI